jgi:hypothetical protein
MALVSPGVQVTITDEAQYLPTALGSVPFVVVATQQDKTINGVTASATTKANANKIYGISSQRELTSLFGAPVFRRSSADTPLHGDELNEYGLMAAYSALGLGNRVWVVRADVDLKELVGTTVRPRGYVPNGTNWLDTGSTRWGIFEFNAIAAQNEDAFIAKSPIIISEVADTSGATAYVPLSTIGNSGDYAVVTLTDRNNIFFKTQASGTTSAQWVQVGSADWAASVPVAVSTRTDVSAALATTGNIAVGSTVIVNGNTFTVSGSAITSIAGLSTALNSFFAASVPGVTTTQSSAGLLQFFANAMSASTGNVAAPNGDISLSDGVNSPLTRLGFFGLPPDTPANVAHAHTGNVSSIGVSWNWNVGTAEWYQPSFTFRKASVTHAPYTRQPLWRREQYTASTPRPSGSVWMKTSAEGSGTNIVYKRYNAVANSWSELATKVYANAYDAIYDLDRAGGGLSIAVGSTFAMQTPLNDGKVGFKVYTQKVKGQTKVTGSNSSMTFTAGWQFTLKASQLDGTAPTFTCTIPTIGSDALAHQKAFVQAILNQNIPNVGAVVETSGKVSIVHRSGGIITMNNVGVNDSLGQAGFTSSTTGVLLHIGGTSGDINLTNWDDDDLYIQSSVTPAADPVDGKLWYYNDPASVDIMINDDTGWKGYRTLTADARGYNLTLTDASGVIVSASQPTTQQSGSPLQSGDLWLDSSDLENYPRLYRYDRVARVWNLINNADRVSQNGIVFADARWDADKDTSGNHIGGILDPVTGVLPSIATMLLSNYIDQDAPDYRLYPRGTLLFNTRRSGYTVKKFVNNYFNAAAFPNTPTVPGSSAVLPAKKSTWVSEIGYKNNGEPKMGHYAQRNEVIAALRSAVDSNTDLREEGYNFNLLAAPGYPELIPNLVALNKDRGQTGFVIGDVSMVLPNTATEIINYEGQELVTADPYLAVYYPSALTNDLSGNEIAVPASHMMLRTYLYNDQVAYPWFAPAGTRRGLIDNALAIGYIDSDTGSFMRTGINNALRDTLYDNRINPITLLNGVGIVAYGQKTRNSAISNAGTSLDRINVARLVAYLRTILTGVANQFIFEPNDKITRDQIKTAIDGIMNDLVAKRGLYDYLVVCDETNNTSDRIARNELYVDVAIEPMKSVEFIYIPIRLKNPGTITGSSVTAQTGQ